MTGILSIVATPIGNLEDITLRALSVLKEADLVLCEDTRVTKKLLARYEITTPTMSYHAHSQVTKIDKILELLWEGKHLALVSDAGTPTISDPGSLLVNTVREKLPEVNIVAIPGASALTAALCVSGLPASEFLFLGFLPRKKGRTKIFEEIADSKRTVVLYESPHRIIKTLSALEGVLGERTIVLARELTKLHEQNLIGTAAELITQLSPKAEKIKGEFVVIISGK